MTDCKRIQGEHTLLNRLGKFLLEEKNNEAIRTQTTFFKSVGMALFDVCAGKLVYERAKAKGLGRELEL